MFGGTASNLGQSTQQGIQIKTIDSIKGTTRFSDLHPDLQAIIKELDDRFQHHISNAGKIREILPGHGDQVATLGPDVAYIEQFLATVELSLDNDSSSVSHLKELSTKDIADAGLTLRAIENVKLPERFWYGNHPTNLTASTTRPAPTTSADGEDDPTKPIDLISYFSKRTDDLGSTLDLYQRQIREIEAHLRTMEAGTVEKAQQLTGSRNGIRDQRRELVEALKAIEGAILDSAKKVGQTRDLVTQQTLGSVGGALL